MQLQLQGITAAHPAASAGVLALRDIHLSLQSGEHVAVIGPSGAGKTTLLHLLACAVRPLAGKLLLDQQDPWQLTTRNLQGLRGDIFLAPQVPPLPPRQRVVTAVSAALLPQMSTWQSLKNLFKPAHISTAHTALAAFDLADKLFERVDRLSGGERQRVGLARCVLSCIASQPQLLLVDEPLSALDQTRSQQAMTVLINAAHSSGATLVCSLHQVDVALAHFPRIIGLRSGEQVFDLPASRITPAVLQALYGDTIDDRVQGAVQDAVQDAVQGELDGGLSAYTAPAVMHCR